MEQKSGVGCKAGDFTDPAILGHNTRATLACQPLTYAPCKPCHFLQIARLL